MPWFVAPHDKPLADTEAKTPKRQAVGPVTDSTDQHPIAGARVSVIGTTIAVPTRDDGSFTLSGVPSGNQRIRATFIGYGAQERTVAVQSGTGARLDFTLSRTAVQL